MLSYQNGTEIVTIIAQRIRRTDESCSSLIVYSTTRIKRENNLRHRFSILRIEYRTRTRIFTIFIPHIFIVFCLYTELKPMDKNELKRTYFTENNVSQRSYLCKKKKKEERKQVNGKTEMCETAQRSWHTHTRNRTNPTIHFEVRVESPNQVQFLPIFGEYRVRNDSQKTTCRVTFAFSFPGEISDWQGRLFHESRSSLGVYNVDERDKIPRRSDVSWSLQWSKNLNKKNKDSLPLLSLPHFFK